ncbi:D-alanyl-D-alanine carboxypeptidase family protein, partial [Actinocorallia lasiicapitis]
AGGGRAVPIASVTKVMTAYVFLEKRPLRDGLDGPEFTISAAEADQYVYRLARQESLIPVHAGQRFTQRRALEAMMTVSANNIAHEIARWTSGGEAAFVREMNATARRLGLRDTHYADSSGYDPGSVSTARDQVILLRAATRLPGFLSVASRKSVVAPGTSQSFPATNPVLGRNGILAGKTGYTSAAGGNFVFVALLRPRGVPTLVYGALLAQTDASASAATALSALPLLTAAQKAITSPATTREATRLADRLQAHPL